MTQDESKLTRDEALSLIADGHAVYQEPIARAVFEALGAAWDDSFAVPMRSDAPGTFKGLTLAPGLEGSRMVTALTIGSLICGQFGIKAAEKFGRGSQGGEYARAIRHYLAEKTPDSDLVDAPYSVVRVSRSGRHIVVMAVAVSRDIPNLYRVRSIAPVDEDGNALYADDDDKLPTIPTYDYVEAVRARNRFNERWFANR